MATSYVSFDEGSTKKVRTFQRTDGGDTVEEWMYVPSESIFDTYSITYLAVAGSTANSHLMQIMAGASNRVGIKRITLYQVANATATTNFPIDIIRLTTAGSGGTSADLRALDPASSAAEATAQVLPSSKGTEGVRLARHRCVIQSTATSAAMPLLDLRFGDNNTKPIYIAAGTSNGICIKNPSADSGVTIDVYVELIEVDWA